jgi:hypothetical protein
MPHVPEIYGWRGEELEEEEEEEDEEEEEEEEERESARERSFIESRSD